MPPSDTVECPGTAPVEVPAPRSNAEQTWEYAAAVGLPPVATYTADELAKMLNVAKDKVMSLMRHGHLRRHPAYSSPWRATAEEVGRFLRLHEETDQ